MEDLYIDWDEVESCSKHSDEVTAVKYFQVDEDFLYPINFFDFLSQWLESKKGQGVTIDISNLTVKDD